jgi:hypothetical protein
MAQVNTTGLDQGPITFNKQAVSSKVSVPWVMTTARVCGSWFAVCKADKSACQWVTCMSLLLIFATFCTSICTTWDIPKPPIKSATPNAPALYSLGF